jgi:molybdopterin-binding protein
VAVGRVDRLDEGLAQVAVAGHRLTALAGEDLVPGCDVLVCIRAEDVALEAPGVARQASPRNHLPAVVRAVAPDGALARVDLDVGFPLAARVTRSAGEDLALAPGVPVVAAVKAPAVHLIRRDVAADRR